MNPKRTTPPQGELITIARFRELTAENTRLKSELAAAKNKPAAATSKPTSPAPAPIAAAASKPTPAAEKKPDAKPLSAYQKHLNRRAEIAAEACPVRRAEMWQQYQSEIAATRNTKTWNQKTGKYE